MLSKQVVRLSRRLSKIASRSVVTAASSSSDRLVVVGSGVAGSATALVAAELYHIPTTVIYAGSKPTDCNSFWAQGGIIYKGAVGEDSPELLAQDIHRAGAGLCHDPAVQKVANEGPERVKQLLLDDRMGIFANVPFQRNGSGDLSVTLGKSSCLNSGKSSF
jgi:L-aspartate oxidase